MRRQFKDWAIGVLFLLIFFGSSLATNVIFKAAMPHIWLFSLVSIALWTTIKFIETKRYKYVYLLALLCGLITLIRPTDFLISLPLLTWLVVTNRELLGSRVFWFRCIFPGILVFFLPIIPQILHWKMITGSWIYYSYGEESFVWSEPAIVNGLFSFRKGWFIYSPIMLMVVPGFILLFKKDRLQFHAIFWPFIIGLYFIFSWWCWWYGGSYGQRPIIEWVPLLCIPLATFIQYLAGQRWYVNSTVGVVTAAMIFHSVFGSHAFMKGRVHYQAMTYESWKALYQNGGRTNEEYYRSLCHKVSPYKIDREFECD